MVLAFGIISILWLILAISYSVFLYRSPFSRLRGFLSSADHRGVQAIRHRDQGHLFLYILEALLAIVAGALLLRVPAAGALVSRCYWHRISVVIGILQSSQR